MTSDRNAKRIKLDHKTEDANARIPSAAVIILGTYELVQQIVIALLARQNHAAVCQVFVLQRLNRVFQNVITTSPIIQQLLHLKPVERCLFSKGLLYWLDLIRESYGPLYPQFFGILESAEGCRQECVGGLLRHTYGSKLLTIYAESCASPQSSHSSSSTSASATAPPPAYSTGNLIDAGPSCTPPAMHDVKHHGVIF